MALVDPAIVTQTGTGTGQGSIVNLDGTMNAAIGGIIANVVYAGEAPGVSVHRYAISAYSASAQ
jgi:hypothetical protein